MSLAHIIRGFDEVEVPHLAMAKLQVEAIRVKSNMGRYQRASRVVKRLWT
jgi:hypothetical protein